MKSSCVMSRSWLGTGTVTSQVPSCFLVSLATCWPEKASVRLSRKAIEHLANRV